MQCKTIYIHNYSNANIHTENCTLPILHYRYCYIKAQLKNLFDRYLEQCIITCLTNAVC